MKINEKCEASSLLFYEVIIMVQVKMKELRIHQLMWANFKMKNKNLG